jgi:hypothetical protein
VPIVHPVRASEEVEDLENHTAGSELLRRAERQRSLLEWRVRDATRSVHLVSLMAE